MLPPYIPPIYLNSAPLSTTKSAKNNEYNDNQTFNDKSKR